MRRRRLVQLLVGIAIAIPVAIEAMTFGDLIGTELLGPEGDGDDGSADADGDAAVGIGDAFLDASPQTERIEGMARVVGDDGSRFRLTVAVENPSEHRYEIAVDRVVFEDGSSAGEPVAGAATLAVGGGGSGVLEATWAVPGDAGPDRIAVTARAGGETYAEEVALGTVPARRAG